jgi:hypothetical protein
MYSSPFLRQQESKRWPHEGDGSRLLMQSSSTHQAGGTGQDFPAATRGGIALDQSRDTVFTSRRARENKGWKNASKTSNSCSLFSTLTAAVRGSLSRVRYVGLRVMLADSCDILCLPI